MKLSPYLLTPLIGVIGLIVAPVTLASDVIRSSVEQHSLSYFIELALENDASRKQFFAQSQAVRERGISSNTLMDPKLKFGIGGLPVDSFKLDDDPMTNMSVGLMQEFGRGSTLPLLQTKANQRADGISFKVKLRELDIANRMSKLWIELGYQQATRKVLLKNQQLMLEMESYIESNYAIGQSEAQDLLNAQLQVSKFDEKLQANAQMQQRILAQFSEWLGSDWLSQQTALTATPQLQWLKLNTLLTQANRSRYDERLSSHPMLTMADAEISVRKTDVAITKQAYKPKFAIEVMYGKRQANGMGGEPASDLFSTFLTVDIPLFTGNKQDRQYSAAQYQVVAAKSNKTVLLSQMNAKVNALMMDRANLKQRLERYESTLIKQAHLRTQAVERGYQNNTAQFNDVIDAVSDELSLEIEKWRLITDLNITYSNLAYLLNGFDYVVSQPQFTNEHYGQ